LITKEILHADVVFAQSAPCSSYRSQDQDATFPSPPHIHVYLLSLSLCGGSTILLSFSEYWSSFNTGKILQIHHLKGHDNEADFLGFLHKWVRHRYLTLHFEPFRCDFEFAEIFEKRLPDSPSRGVDKNAYRYKCFQTFESIKGVSTLHPRLIFGYIGP
jgi:hypothetical protein